MGPLGWAIVLVGPAGCAAAGALAAWLFLRGRYERELDYWEQEAYDRGRYDESLQERIIAPDRPTVILHRPSPAHHARPEPTPDAAWADAAVASIRARFDAIRHRFGLPELGVLDGPQAAELHHLADGISPRTRTLVRAMGHAAGPSWPPAGPVG